MAGGEATKVEEQVMVTQAEAQSEVVQKVATDKSTIVVLFVRHNSCSGTRHRVEAATEEEQSVTGQLVVAEEEVAKVEEVVLLVEVTQVVLHSTRRSPHNQFHVGSRLWPRCCDRHRSTRHPQNLDDQCIHWCSDSLATTVAVARSQEP